MNVITLETKPLPHTEYRWSWRVANGYLYESDEKIDYIEDQKWEHQQWIKENYSWLTERRLLAIFGLLPGPVGKKAYITTEELLERIDLQDVISQYAETVLVRDGECMAKCPFHEDKRASLGYNRKKGLWTCYGCGEGGTAIHFVMKAEDVDYLRAKDLIMMSL